MTDMTSTSGQIGQGAILRHHGARRAQELPDTISRKLLCCSDRFLESNRRMQASSKADKSCRQSLLDDRNEPTQHHTQRWLTAVSLLLCALLVSVVLLGGSYQQNALLQQRLSGKLPLMASLIGMRHARSALDSASIATDLRSILFQPIR